MASIAHLQAPVAAHVSRVKSEDLIKSEDAQLRLTWPGHLFSLAGRAFDDLRQKMKEEMLEILMWAVSTKKNVRGINDATASTPTQLRSSRYIRYRDKIGNPRYGES
jgi:hypothetical protein